MSEHRACKACGTPLWFVKTAEGKIIPLDTKAPVFYVETDLTGNPVAVRATSEFAVTHFATCTAPNVFSKGKKK